MKLPKEQFRDEADAYWCPACRQFMYGDCEHYVGEKGSIYDQRLILREKKEKVVENNPFDDFLDRVKGIGGNGVYVEPFIPHDVSYSNKRSSNPDYKKPSISVKWCTGGISGGSCWDTGECPDPHYAMSGEDEPEFEELDRILEAVCPNITFLQYKNLCNGLIKRDDYSQNEYYGNCTNYAVKYVVLEELFEKLKEKGLL